jgi:hypothetical protein
MMDSSLDEINQEINITNERINQNFEWYKEDVLKKAEMESLFAKDNFFMFDKETWRSILARKIVLKSTDGFIKMKKST